MNTGFAKRSLAALSPGDVKDRTMGFFADRLGRIKPSPTMAVTGRAAELKAAGHDVIGLGAGEPDFDTPEHVKEAAIAALRAGYTKYTAVDGAPDLKQAICDKFRRDNGLDYAPEQAIVGVGGKQVLFNAMLATVNHGDEVIVPRPYWVSYPDMVRIAGGEPVFVDSAADTAFRMTPEALEAAISPRTKWLILNSPSNPSGSAYAADELRALADVLERHPHVWIMADDIYEKVVYDGFAFTTIAQVAPALYDRTLTVNGVSKAYAMTGWRVGFAGGPAPLIRGMAKIQSQSTTNATSIAQAAAVAALNGDHGFLAARNAAFKARRDRVASLLNAIPGLSCRVPEGAFYLYPSCAGVIGRRTPDGATLTDSEDYVRYMLDSVGVAVVHGAAFGLDPHFRISYATSDDVLEDACARIRRATEALR